MHQKNIITAGEPLEKAEKALILIHGRGATADSILGLANELKVENFALFAPQATNHTWYPYSFLTPANQNEPWLSSALEILWQLEDEIVQSGIASENIYFTGFSQGACLVTEYIARNAKKYGGAAAFIGGLIGEELKRERYSGDFHQTPVFLGTSNPDVHVPVERVEETAKVLEEMNARVKMKTYENVGHTIVQDAINEAKSHVF